jgi:ABC-type Fe3+-siderophore transport system permease subunit
MRKFNYKRVYITSFTVTSIFLFLFITVLWILSGQVAEPVNFFLVTIAASLLCGAVGGFLTVATKYYEQMNKK